ncbi:acetyl-CoA carboxylase biotin carboxylase subunit [Wolbachia endosymbiont of Diaphorina citri]|jgi:Acetyl/propionyl-CoA carboxylase, alpha subunit|uniref:acetyl-CoA carboxylase biotin carboxylase subunit n=1 Tax=Wolbachia endosymbiont of Diaphorina citri TaxID=116598 RepID=UPI00037B74C5|nr:acetyl-CoA carboxylase biotin carboxylase subunit [Wolbachia endosymbiont of Diaphorina citri]QJT94610.1 acetyl-CoA carboxylase biotin carboxylase subunit [Wolbachia endosymbiont of Diaphorina citri]QJT95849.1 acetyl-CoA carboxylase biotin carboxylase subunit [Wolbachia endosymbiont of Diaphorina citri]QJT97211.1 acetyl-CoA carboxylase biotin carboxylase subunit [Wolbachia endosymbiont of Diaphorina citri]QLK11508.1 acetyl-CoA carboxylase biotin carboxylase subunit [Wolbachia endosymbiont of
MIRKKYSKILVANRGEIACRIIKTAHKMGISCVSVYSDADANSVHVKQADESRHIGPSPAYLSYLNIEKICEVAVETGAEAVHPGYGFLAENPDFPRALEKHNIDFIGPSAETIEVTANKITAKEEARKAGVNVVPGYMGKIEDAAHAAIVAEEIGFPVMLKAASGGGGKGMRIVYSKKEIELAFTSATNEAEKSFKDGSIFIEKYIELPRHIEIQIIADKYGNIVCLGERECSVQRNNQKIIEETPSPFISEEVRQKMYAQCVSLAKQVDYFSAGTVEFVVDKNQNFYFLEVNTRLQVEHPVTEFVTGIDIVEEMIRISCGEKLRFGQNDIKLIGSAIESRICAEDPSKKFFPSSGRIKYYDKPDDVRIDDGVASGSEISMFYDSMIAKIITYGKDRIEAISRMQKALSKCYIEGVTNNIEFLESIFHNPNFIAAKLHTRFIPNHYPGGFQGDLITEEYIKIFIFTALYVHLENEGKYYSKSTDEAFIVKIDDNEYSVNAKYQDNTLTTVYNHNKYSVVGKWKSSYRLLYITINDDTNIALKIERQGSKYFIRHAGMKAKCCVLKPHVAELSKLMLNNKTEGISVDAVKSPISGLLVKLHVNAGDQVEVGQPLFVVEAMKMENIICAESEMVIKNIPVKEGKNIHAGDLVLDLVS